MKLEKDTLNVLKSFAQINGNIVLEENTDVIRSKSQAGNLLAWYRMPNEQEKFPVDFPIFELSTFLSSLALFEDPSLEFEKNLVSFKDEINQRDMKYFAGFKDTLQALNDKPFTLLEPIVEFDFNEDTFATINKTVSTMRVNDIAIIGDGKDIIIKVAKDVHVKSVKTNNTYTMKIGETDRKFEVFFDIDALKIIPTDYTMSLCLVKGHVVIQLLSDEQADGSQLLYYCLALTQSSIDQ